MEENLNNNQQPPMQEPKKQDIGSKTKKKKAKIAVITLSTIIVLVLGLQIYAATNGYGNIFFMIRDWTTSKNASGEDEVFKEGKIEELNEESNTSKTTNTNNNNDTDADFFEKNANIQYNNDLTNSINGKAAIIKSGEEELKTTQNNGYYTYTDMWNNSYNIKKIKDVKSEFTQLGKDKQSALYKCTIYYIDNNNQDKNFDVAVIVSKDAEGGILGKYDSYTGSTRYTRWVGLYEEGNTENNQLEPDNYAEEVMKYEKETKGYLGVWKVKKAYNDTKEVSLQEIYGTSVKYGVGNLSINTDGTFTDKIAPVHESEDSRAGKYMINDNEIVLKYNNGNSRSISYNSVDKVITYNVFDKYYLVMEKQGK